MIDTKRILDQLVGSGAAGGFAGGVAGGALSGLLMGNKKTQKLAGSALKLGGLALVGGLAYKAWQNHRQTGTIPGSADLQPPPTEGSFIPATDDQQGQASLGLLLARAMISAAKADGQIDLDESQRILDQINRLALPEEEKAFLFEEYRKPLDVAGLVTAVDTPEHAAEVYAASLLMVVPPTPPEQIYLDTLARELRLEADLVREIQSTVAEQVSP